MSTLLFSITNDLPTRLTDIQVVNVIGYDGNGYYALTTLGYYREPKDKELPLELRIPSKTCVDYTTNFENDLHCCQYLQQFADPRRASEKFDYCTNRGTLLKIMYGLETQLVATKFRGCIYLKLLPTTNSALDHRFWYVFKLRHFLIVDQPGDMPNINKPVDLNRQNFGFFTAKLGKFRLIYSSEIIGVENSEPLGNLYDPEVLKKCRFIIPRVVPKNAIDWRTNYRMKRWLLQAHLTGIDQLKVAKANHKGTVTTPIITEDAVKLMKEQSWCLSECVLLLNQYLSRINDVMADIDCPYTTFVFNKTDDAVSFQRVDGKNENSFLSEEYIRNFN